MGGIVMYKELWNVIKNLTNNAGAIDTSKLALASHQLPVEVFETVKEHYSQSSEIERRYPPWV